MWRQILALKIWEDKLLDKFLATKANIFKTPMKKLTPVGECIFKLTYL